MFIPTTKQELKKIGWNRLDVILVTGDSYIDSPFIGIAIIGKVLIKAGFKVGIIAQPDVDSERDISRLGEPNLFWGVSGGCIDSMIANYTASKKPRKKDDYTPGNINDRRPDRAVIVYTNLIKRYFKKTAPIVLGGIEASLRRIAHYDFWSDKIRKSILFDAKADFIVYGMGEKSTVELAFALKNKTKTDHIKGICYISNSIPDNYIKLPSYEENCADKHLFIKSFVLFHQNNDPNNAKGVCQKQDLRYLIQNPPAKYLTTKELDEIYDMEFERDLHPFYKKHGNVKALETIKFSISTHRGCYGECNFCAIALHEGRTIRWRSEESILKEATTIASIKDFKGNILDVGGPSANMYGYECNKKLEKGACQKKRCLYPEPCKNLNIDHKRHIDLLKRLRQIKSIKKIFVASGIRYDLVLHDKKHGYKYLNDIIEHHVSGQMKIAPEHTQNNVLNLMGKPGKKELIQFKALFDKLTNKLKKKQFLTYYLMVAHPGCTMHDMLKLKAFIKEYLKVNPRQVQIFTPSPSTYSTVMYYTGINPFNGKKVFVEKNIKGKIKQKNLLFVDKYGKK